MTITISGTTGLAGVDGSAGTPAVQGADTNTGVFFPAADTVAIATGGTERVRTDSSGNVGIGTSSPQRKLDVTVNDTTTAQLYLRNNNASYASGFIVYNAGGEASIFRHNGGSDTSYAGANSVNIGSVTNNVVAFIQNNTERARIDSSGNLLVGTTTSSGSGNLIAAGVYNNTTASGANVQVDNTGPGLLRRSTSSIVYKTNVEPIDAAYIANALKFRPVWYRSLCDGDRKDWSWYGLIAEEVGAIDPRLVHWRMLETSVDENGQTVQTPLEKPVAEGVMYDRVVVLALGLIQKQEKAIQELTAKLDAAEARIAALEAA